MKKILFLIYFALICSTLAVHSQNLLANPGFENWAAGKPSGWNSTNITYIAPNTVDYNESTMSCKVTNVPPANVKPADFNIYQYVAVTPGKVYTFRVSYYIETGDGTDARLNCYFRDATDKYILMSLEDSLALKGPGGNTAYFPNVLGSWQTYTCDVIAPVGASTFAFYLRTGSYGTVSWDNCYFAINTTPTVYKSKSSLTGFTYLPGNGPSAEQTVNVSANNLTGSMTVTAPTNYEISAQSGPSFVGTNSITISSSLGAIASMPIYVRLKSSLPLGNYNGNMTIAAAGATMQNVTLTGSVAVPPVVITPSVSTLSGFTYSETTGGPSAQKLLNVTGSGLTSGIVITPPTNYEISVISGAGFTSQSITLAQNNGVIAKTTIYVRLKTALTQGTYNGNLTLVSNGVTKTVALAGNVTLASGLVISKTSLIGFAYGLGAGPSPEQSFTVNGNALTAFIIVTTPSGFEVSTDTGALFSGSNYLILPQSGGLTPLYVRLMADYPVGTYAGSITLTSGAYTQNVNVNGNVWITTGNENVTSGVFKAYGNGNELVIEGSTANELIQVYNLVGQQIKSVQSKGERLTIPVKAGSVYLVKNSAGITKVIM